MLSDRAMNRMRERLERALHQGMVLSAAMAACSSQQLDDGTGATGGQAGKGGTVIPSGAGKGGKVDGPLGCDGPAMGGQGGSPGQGLLPYPRHDYPQCSGENYGGESSPYGGQCCVTAQCFAPKSGECPAADKVGSEELPAFPSGSGSCLCPSESGAVEGPFAPRADDKPTTPGPCCYLVAGIGCTGRPLLVGGVARVAGAVRRAGWASRPSWV